MSKAVHHTSPLPCYDRACSRKESCAICFENFVDPADPANLLILPDFNCMSCGHVFHSQCIESWMEINNSCPICRDRDTHVVYTGHCTQNTTFTTLERWVKDRYINDNNNDNVEILNAVLYNQPTTTIVGNMHPPGILCIINSLLELCKSIAEDDSTKKLRNPNIDPCIHIGHGSGSWVTLKLDAEADSMWHVHDDSGRPDTDRDPLDIQQIRSHFSEMAYRLDDTIILELGIRDQPSFLDYARHVAISKVIAGCTDIKTCLRHKLILQEGVEVVPYYDESDDVQRIIFLRFSIQGDSHVAGSGDHCCGKEPSPLHMKRQREEEELLALLPESLTFKRYRRGG